MLVKTMYSSIWMLYVTGRNKARAVSLLEYLCRIYNEKIYRNSFKASGLNFKAHFGPKNGTIKGF